MNKEATLTPFRLLQRMLPLLMVATVYWSRLSYAQCAVPLQLGCHCTTVEGPAEIRCENNGFRRIPGNFTNPDSLTIVRSKIHVLQEVFYPTLVALRLERDGITAIEDGAFRGLTELNVLVLAHNSIAELSKETFRGLQNLELLSLEGNMLYEIRSDVFTGEILPRLEFLKLSRCRIFSVEPNAFAGLQNLYHLNLARNYIEELPVLGNEDGLRKLTELDVSENALETVHCSTFKHLSALKHLFLNGNAISVLQSDFVCSHLAKTLQSLWLRRNRIASVEKNALGYLENLVTLDVSFNSLRELDSDEIPWSSVMKLLVHHNPWDCSGCRNSWLVKKSLVRAWNDANGTATCDAPDSSRGVSVFDSTSFDGCWPQEKQRPQNTTVKSQVFPPTVLLLAIVAWGLCIATAVVIIVFRRIRRRSAAVPFQKLDNEELEPTEKA